METPRAGELHEAVDSFSDSIKEILSQALDEDALLKISAQVGQVTTNLRQSIDAHMVKCVHAKRSQAISDGMRKAAKKGQKIGNMELSKKIIAETVERDKALLPIFQEIISAGARSFSQVGRALNEQNVPSATGGKWHSSTARNVMKRNGLVFQYVKSTKSIM